MEKRNRKAGFTLIELLVVMLILGLLAALVGPKLFGKVGKAKIKAAKAQISLIEDALDAFRLDVGRYPTTEEGLQALVEQPSGMDKWDGPYLKKRYPKIHGTTSMFTNAQESTVTMTSIHLELTAKRVVRERTPTSQAGISPTMGTLPGGFHHPTSIPN